MITLADVISRVESADNPLAMRFEPTVFRRLIATPSLPMISTIRAIHKCNINTAVMIAATSWGRFQIMGENLYTVCWWEKPIALYLVSVSLSGDTLGMPDFQRDTFGLFVAQKFSYNAAADATKFDDPMLRSFAAFYNGPADVDDYVIGMKKAIRELSA